MGIYKGRGAIHPGGFTIQRGQSVAPTASQRSGLRIPCAAGYGYFLGIMIGFAKGGAGIWAGYADCVVPPRHRLAEVPA